MPTTAPDVGTGTTVVFSGTSSAGTIGNVLRVNLDGVEFAPIEITNLASVDSRKFMRGDLANLGGFTIDAQFPPGTDMDVLPVSGVSGTGVQTLTLTFPGGATLAGECFITKVGNISVETESVMTYSISGVFTGGANTAVFTTSWSWTD